jgi:hypothetical protein
MIKECVSEKIVTLNLYNVTLKKLDELGDNFKVDLPYLYYSYDVNLYKKKLEKKVFRKELKEVFCKIASFSPYMSEITVYEKDAYDLCKKLGDELKYETILKEYSSGVKK